MEWGRGLILDFYGAGQNLLGGSCECGNEHSGSIKWEEFLDKL